MPTCQSCRAEVVFVPSAKTGKSMILDAKPEKGVALLHFLAVIEPEARAAAPHAEQYATVIDVYTDHHVTCPKAQDWQGRTRKSPPVRSIATGAVDG